MPRVDSWAPSYVVIGHVSYDVVAGGRCPGGTALFAALMADHLGESVGVVTSAGSEFVFDSVMPGIAIANRPAPTTTVFENIAGPARRQRLHGRAADLRISDIPASWLGADIVHLAPLAGEVPAALVGAFPRSLVGVTAQGWLRRWDDAGWVSPRPLPSRASVLFQADAMIVSDEDLGGDEAAEASFASRSRLLVVTRGSQGATVYREGKGVDVSSFLARVVDTVGAGDVFSAAFLVALRRGIEPMAAARFGCATASLFIEQAGADGIPSEAAIRERLTRG